MKKFEAALESEKTTRSIEDQEHSRHILACSPDVEVESETETEVPFGARALERGVQIEGIWVSSSETVDQIPKEFSRGNPGYRPSVPMTGSPLKMVDVNDDGDGDGDGDGGYPKYPSASHPTGPLTKPNANATSDDGNLSGGSNAPRASQQSYRTVDTYPDAQQHQQRQSAQWLGPRSPWITRPMPYKRWSGVSGMSFPLPVEYREQANDIDGHRQSTEEFRRRFSKLFDEQLQAPAIDNLQLNSVPPIAEANDRPYRSYYRA